MDVSPCVVSMPCLSFPLFAIFGFMDYLVVCWHDIKLVPDTLLYNYSRPSPKFVRNTKLILIYTAPAPRTVNDPRRSTHVRSSIEMFTNHQRRHEPPPFPHLLRCLRPALRATQGREGALVLCNRSMTTS